jgi:calcineurin-like phosphoesterase family protein
MLIDWFQDKEEVNRVWFTADQHFGHGAIIKHCNRPFPDAETMDRALIEKWNEVVGPDDIVVHLGEFTLGDVAAAESYFLKLQGRIFILANEWHHDRRWLTLAPNTHPPCHILGSQGMVKSANGHIVQALPPLLVLEIPWLSKQGYPLAITLCHYPLAEWDRKHYGAWHLHGHSHGRHKHEGDGYILDVDVDAHNFCPINLSGVLERMSDQGWR